MNLLERLKAVRVFIFDVDGVLTDGSLYVFASGEQVRRMNIKDGFALQLAIKKGYRLLVISGSSSEGVEQRLNRLGIKDVFMKVENKREFLDAYIKESGLSAAELLFMGDDMPDYAPMKICGIACAPADAMPEIKGIAHFISRFKGGEGCVREIIERVLKLNGHWEVETDVPSK